MLTYMQSMVAMMLVKVVVMMSIMVIVMERCSYIQSMAAMMLVKVVLMMVMMVIMMMVKILEAASTTNATLTASEQFFCLFIACIFYPYCIIFPKMTIIL